MKTFMAKKEDVAKRWYVIDATDEVLGRISTKVAGILMGKHRCEYTPHTDVGDFVIVTNAAKVRLTGKKLQQKSHERYSGYPSGRRVVPLAEVFADKPEEVVRESVRRMLPKTKLGRQMLGKLKVYAGSDHPHQAQQPEVLEL
ncbi:MAG: 50S ribosomal protein L13 [Phycisphaerae bacterium]